MDQSEYKITHFFYLQILDSLFLFFCYTIEDVFFEKMISC